jgi:hypothetical protein
MNHLSMLFQDFFEFIDENKNDEAMSLFQQAENYAKEYDVVLPAGWQR